MLGSNLSARRGSAGDSRGNFKKVAPLSLFRYLCGEQSDKPRGSGGGAPVGSCLGST